MSMPNNSSWRSRSDRGGLLRSVIKVLAASLVILLVIGLGVYFLWPWERMYFNGCERGDIRQLEIALRVRPDLVNKDLFGDTPLGKAAVNGYKAHVVLLLMYGADPNARDHMVYTALHTVAFTGEKEIMKVLIDHGGNPNIQTPNGTTALHQAAKRGEAECIEILLGAGADPSLRDVNDKTALDLAGEEGYADIVEILKEYGSYE